MKDLVNLYLQEQEKLKKYQKSNPELVTPKRNFTYQEILEHIGINIDFGYLPQGYLNYYHHDFIVEEINKNGEISSIEPENLELSSFPASGEKTLYADLVKVGHSTLEARESLAQALGILINQINYAGIKDKVAITSQRISIRGVDSGKIKNLKASGLFLKNFTWGKGVVEKGHLGGNQFVILVRTPATLGQGWLDQALERVSNGFYNFYYLQRFGSPRLLSHKLGKLILQQDYQQVVRTFLTSTGVQDLPLLNKIRQQAEKEFGNWGTLEELLFQLPYTFRLELGLIRYLKSKPKDYLGALKTIFDQTTLWVYAYASYLFNSHLSGLINQGNDLPKELPLLLNPNHSNIETYIQQLKEDEIEDLEPALKNIFARSPISEKNTCLTKVPVKIIKTKIIEKGVVIAFQLPVGAYATTFLTHLFSLYRGLPIPEWLDDTKHDGKKILEIGSIEKVEKILGDYIFSLAVKE